MNFFIFSFILLLCAMTGCSQEKKDVRAAFDFEVEQRYFRAFDQADAIRFLSDGGVYVDGDEEPMPLDRLYILPLLERMHSGFSVNSRVVVSKSDSKLALAIVVKIADEQQTEDVKQFLLQEQETFPGEILQQWGYRWLSLDFLNEEDAKELERLEEDLVNR